MRPYDAVRDDLTRQFRPAGPRDLASVQYAADFNEVKAPGKDTGSTGTAEQTQIGLFWGDNNQIHWNRIALDVAAHRSDGLVYNAAAWSRKNVVVCSGWDLVSIAEP